MMSYLRSTFTAAVSSILVAYAMFMFTGSAQAQSLARFDFNGEAGQGENGGPTQTGWSGFDSNSVGGNHHFGPPGSIAINIGSVGLNSVRDRLPEYSGVSNLESSPVVDVTRDFIVSSNATLEVRVRFLEPNTTYDLRWHHYEAAHDDSGNQLAVYINDNSVPANKLFETELYGQSTSNFWTDFTATSDGTGQIALFSGDHSSGSAANPYFNGFEVVSAAGPQIPDTDFTWNLTGLGDWNDFASWLPFTGPPNDANHTATFGNAIQNNSTVVVDSPVTINRINFDHTLSYVIGGHGSVSLVATTSEVLPTLAVTQGSHEFQAAVNLMADTTATVASDSTLAFNNALNLMGHALTKTGDGTLAINNQLTTAGGVLNVQQGTVSGHGAIGGNVNNDGGTISPGNGASLLKANSVPEPTTWLLMLIGLATYVSGSPRRKRF